MKTIIIVDDSGTFQRIIEGILKPHFKILGTGSDGFQGFELYKKLKPDLVLMDITMPNCDGKESLQKILVLDPHAKVVMVSGINDGSTVTECLAMGAKAFVCKSEISSKSKESSPLIKIVTDTLGEVSASQEAA